MSENSWPENNSSSELESLSSLLADLSGWSESDFLESEFYQGRGGRRRKAALTLMVIWSGTLALHLFSFGYWLVWGATTLMGVHALRVLLARSPAPPGPLSTELPEADHPFVSLLVAAKNEEAVIERLVATLCNLDYPCSRFEVWIVDDNSTDRTPLLLERFAQQYSQLRVLKRQPGAGGGKSGALNQVLPLTQGEIIGVFDADARVPRELLRQVLPLFQQPQVGAVQVRKAIANATTNFLTQAQKIEMVLDAFFQQQRVALGGIGELRGNGQFVRRQALESCGAWNEETITDDLDLTLRLHLDQWDIKFLSMPAVQEEAVTRLSALWHQRNRWAEGGYQRYLDYWRLIGRNRLGIRKTLDLFMFWLTQYILPMAAIPDSLLALARHRPPMLLPLMNLTITLSFLGMVLGLHRLRKAQKLPGLPLTTLIQALQGTLYMLHWFPIIASTTARISVRPKRLKWVKTIHQGSEEIWLDAPEQP